MAKFFEYCVKCKQMFQDEMAWAEHLRQHEAARKQKLAAANAVPEQQKVESAADIPGASAADIEDERLAKTRDLRAVKKELKKAGVECQTMTADEARAAYDNLKKQGRVN